MRPDPSDVASVLAVLALLALALPKREWRGIRARLRLTARGGRRYLFGPPAPVGPLPSDLGRRAFELLRAELRRAFELGVPLELAAWCAEASGASRAREREAAWRERKSGLLFRHLAGEMTESELHERLRVTGQLLPAAELAWTPPRRYTMPPMSWRIEWERRLEELRGRAAQGVPEGDAPAAAAELTGPMPAPGPASAPVAVWAPAAGPPAAPVPPAAPELELRTLGEIRVLVDGEDVAPGLMHRPAQAFTLLYLLAREVRRPGDRVTRAVFAEESFRGQGPEEQRRGIRQRLAHLNRQLQPALRKRIKTDGEYLSFDAAGCEIDVCRLFRTAGEAKAAAERGDLSAELLEEARRALGLSAHEFLPGWEDIERRGSNGGSGAAEIVSEVRDRVVAARLDILGALAHAALARQDMDDAIAYLEEALRCRPERAGLARKLADVYERSGQRQRAGRLREEYGLEDERLGDMR